MNSNIKQPLVQDQLFNDSDISTASFDDVNALFSGMSQSDLARGILVSYSGMPSFTQPGMHYSQAQDLVYSLLQDEVFNELSSKERQYVIDRILSEVRGRMLEDIVLLESMKALPEQYEVFKFQFETSNYVDGYTTS